MAKGSFFDIKTVEIRIQMGVFGYKRNIEVLFLCALFALIVSMLPI